MGLLNITFILLLLHISYGSYRKTQSSVYQPAYPPAYESNYPLGNQQSNSQDDVCSCALKTSLVAFELLDNGQLVPPCKICIVRFPCGLNVYWGNEVYFEETAGEPYVTWDADPDRYYMLILYGNTSILRSFFLCNEVPNKHTVYIDDVDIPSRSNATGLGFLNWQVANIRGNDVSSGIVLYEFLRTIPRYRVGFHRVVYLIYEQPGVLCSTPDPVSNRTVADRDRFDLLATEQAFRLITPPVAANFFTIRFSLVNYVL